MNTTWLAGFFDGAGNIYLAENPFRAKIVFSRPLRYSETMYRLLDMLRAMGYHPLVIQVGLSSIRLEIGRRAEVQELARTLLGRVESVESEKKLQCIITACMVR
jgi:hypothetical protein